MSRASYEPLGDEGEGSSPATVAANISVVKIPFPPEVVNPFVNNLAAHNTVLQWIKMILLGLILFPIRLLGFILFILLAWTSAKLSMVGYTDAELLEKPMKEGFFKKGIYVFARCCMFCLGYQWFESDDSKWMLRPDGSRRRAPIVVINHSTVCDGFLLYYTHGLMSVGVNSVAELPFFATYAKAAQAFSLDRDDVEGRRKIGAEMLRRACWTEEQTKTLGQWNPLSVFAEGTCTNQKALIQFRHGAFLPGVEVQPMVVRYPFRYCDQSWCGLDSPGGALLRLMCQFHNRLQYEYLPIYEPSEEEKKDPFLYAYNVRKVMAEAMKVPTTEHTYEDMRLSSLAQRLGIPWRSIHCEMGYFRAHGSTYERAKAAVQRFAAVDLNRDGYLSRDELCQAMCLGDASSALGDAVVKVWNNGAVAENPQRAVSFRHFYFMTGLRVLQTSNSSTNDVQPAPSHDAKLGADQFLYDTATESQKQSVNAWLFRNFDKDGDGHINLEDFRAAFYQALPSLSSSSIEATQSLTALYSSNASTSSTSGWDMSIFEQFLVNHPLLTEHLLATL